MLRVIQMEQEVPRPRDEVFAYFDRPENLSDLTPPEMGFEILTPRPLLMQTGALIDYVVRIGGIGVRWTSLIPVYEPPDRFVDVQLRGPYSYWHHEHTFRETGSGTLIGDVISYAMPLGPLGDLAHALFVRRRLERIFAYRRRRMIEIFGPTPLKKQE